MRLWTIHPRYLDSRGLVALWREALLARAVIRGETRGYRSHPQVERFLLHPAPRAAINAYLAGVHAEACARGYAFDRRKIGPTRGVSGIEATSGQVAYEWEHLLAKLCRRNPECYQRWRELESPECHPLFTVVPGPVETWERVSPAQTH